MTSHLQVQVIAGAGIRSRRASRRCLSSIRKISYFPFRENFLGWYDVFVISSVSAMRKIPVVLLIAGLASFAVGCSPKQKIVYVTEFISCLDIYRSGWDVCRNKPYTNSHYLGHKGVKLSTELDAAASVCKSISMFKSEFTDKVNSEKFRIVSTTDWVDESQSYKNVIDGRFGQTPQTTDDKVRCIGKEYVVTY